ncbi:MAG: hypothetical protein KDE26_27625, partial [Bacteroidetes bacterium]|nr:hypothetical protein [Bacteroidota bacterium]
DITDTEVVYVIEKEGETELFMLEKKQISTIMYGNGDVVKLNEGMGEVRLIDLEQKSAVKIELPSPFFNHLILGYERSLVDHIGLEVNVGIIGIGLVQMNKPVNFSQTYELPDTAGMLTTYGNENIISRERGSIIRIGPKFTLSQKNSLVGWYIKPEFVYSRITAKGRRFFSEPGISTNFQDFTWTFEGTSLGAMARIGIQGVRKNKYLFDINIGFGFTKESDVLSADGVYVQQQLPSRYRSNGQPFFRYSHFVFSERAYAIGIAAGILL